MDITRREAAGAGAGALLVAFEVWRDYKGESERERDEGELLDGWQKLLEATQGELDRCRELSRTPD